MKKNTMLLLAILFVMAFLAHHYNIDGSNVQHPALYTYDGDFLFSVLDAKNISTTGWVYSNDKIGMPFGSNILYYPSIALRNFDELIIKIILSFTSNPFIATNIFFLLIPVLIVTTTFYTLIEMKVQNIYAFAGSITYALLPYYFQRNIIHLVLSSYYFVPFSILICYWCYNEMIFKNIFNLRLFSKRDILTIIFTLLIANNGIAYYPAFTCFFLLITACIMLNKKRTMRAAYPAICSLIMISLFFLLNMVPVIYNNYSNGKNTHVVNREIYETDIYGMKITQLVLPSSLQGKTTLENRIRKYLREAPLSNENSNSYLGPFATIGFFILLYRIFFPRHCKKNENNTINFFAQLNLSGILLATIGGFSSIFAVFITPMLRGYNRISVFIAFISIYTICKICCDIIHEEKFYKYHNCINIMLLAFVFAGIFVQVPPKSNFDSKAFANKQYDIDKSFVNKIEASVPKGSMIYQLPYTQFPEVFHYHLLLGPLHSQDLRWSYGSIRGSRGDILQRDIDLKPIPEKIKSLSLIGFNGIYLDARLYDGNKLDIITKAIEKELGVTPIKSEDGNIIFYSMLSYNKQMTNKFDAAQIKELREQILNKPYVDSIKGIYAKEKKDGKSWSWMEKDAEIIIENPGRDYEKNIQLNPILYQNENGNVYIDVNGKVNKFCIEKKQNIIQVPLRLKYGKNVIKIHTDVSKLVTPHDRRNLYLLLMNFDEKDLI